MSVKTYPGHGWVPTHSGKKFNALNPRVEDVDINDIAWGLSNVCRWGGQCDPPFTVGQHCLIGSYLVPDEHALRFLLHDAGEAYPPGDVQSPLKRQMPELRAVCDRVQAVVYEAMGISGEDPEIIKTVDLRLGLTELRLLFPHEFVSDYTKELFSQGYKPYGFPIVFTPAHIVREKYLQRYYELAGN